MKNLLKVLFTILVLHDVENRAIYVRSERVETVGRSRDQIDINYPPKACTRLDLYSGHSVCVIESPEEVTNRLGWTK